MLGFPGPIFRRRGRRCPASSSPLLAETAEELEAFLSGHVISYLSDRRCELPAWSWLNCVAHGDLEQVRRLAVEQPEDGEPAAVAVAIAREALAGSAGGEKALRELQRRRLLPLELALAAGAGRQVVSRADELRVLLAQAQSEAPDPLPDRARKRTS